MHSVDLPPNRSLEKPAPTSFGRSIVTGAIGFCLTSLIVFGTVAFGQRWMYHHLGITGAYLVWIALFILLGGFTLSALLSRPRRLARFYAIFGAAFLVYGVSWMAAYFTLGDTAGEWLGTILGSLLMALVFAAGFRSMKSMPAVSAVLFVGNLLGYFVGSLVFYRLTDKAGLLVWGVIYGIFVGGGLGAALYLLQSRQLAGPGRTPT